MMHLNFVLAALFVAGAASAPLNGTLPAGVATSDVAKLPAQSAPTNVTVPTAPTSAVDVKAEPIATSFVGEWTTQTVPKPSSSVVKIETVPNPSSDATLPTISTTSTLAARDVPSSVYQHSSRAVETSVLSSAAAESSALGEAAAESSAYAKVAPQPSALSSVTSLYKELDTSAVQTSTAAVSTLPNSLATPAVGSASSLETVVGETAAVTSLSAAPTAAVTSSVAALLASSVSASAPTTVAVAQRSESDLELAVEPEVHADEHGVDAEVEVEPKVQDAELEVEPEVHAGDDGVAAEVELERRADVDAGCEGAANVHANARRAVPALPTTVDVVRPAATSIPPLGRV
ncbi:hypothetical protein K466DRAFT_655957 [Polyporus arcularius HHB13444]|uniref:Uncharacterized protein n=1 Tax=Polyporus arcularius HHB13444 TaxID=1314778 RepID=A0A5C3NXA0_9APHY|nr:hypothetical protein K466DRAFT_655957 [Polyporus arcularius HHB13444]